jgi:Leucine-rich repeat (LRR) protein
MNRYKLPRLSNPSLKNNELKNLNSRNAFRDKDQEEAVKKATDVGFLIYPSKSFILKQYEKQLGDNISVSQKSKNDSISFLNKNTASNTPRKAKTRLDIFIDDGLIDERMDEMRYLNLSSVPIAELGEISLCQNLVILNLSNNYLVNIDALSDCIHLFRIDLQNNQVYFFSI